VADMSSNYLSKPIDVKKYGVIYGTACQILPGTSLTRTSTIYLSSCVASYDVARSI
jgi:phosphoserine aminotransferase